MIDEANFASVAELGVWCDRLGHAGLRNTGSAAHEATIAWIEDELRSIPGLRMRHDAYAIERWQPSPFNSLHEAGRLEIGSEVLPVAGAIPYSLPATATGAIAYLPPGEPITPENAAGKIIMRDFPHLPLPYDRLLDPCLHASPDCEALRGGVFDRPGMADSLIHADLLAAGRAGAAGMIVGFDLPHDQVAGYFEPHKGTHYSIPALFVGQETWLKLGERKGSAATITVRAEVSRAQTLSIFATLPGTTDERIVIATHTDGNTWVQENGPAALLGLARYFAALPLALRNKTIEFAFTTAHLHISREGSVRFAAQLDAAYERGDVAFVLALEHLGAREIVPIKCEDGPGRRLEFTGDPEPLLWAVGPSGPLRRAVEDAVQRRGLRRTIVAPGLGPSDERRVPHVASFGGIGSYFHQRLIPTTSLITGPWSLWAPFFGKDAIDLELMRQQILAAGDVVCALDRLPGKEIAGDYLADRTARAAGAPTALEDVPPELATRHMGQRRGPD